jgi:hypothetical protein
MSSKIDECFNKQHSPQKEICLRLRELLFKTFPGIEEEMKWGVPAYAGGNYYILALKDHVNLGFTIKGLTKEEAGLFDGGGKTTRHIQVASLSDIDEQRIVTLLKLVGEKARA